MYTGTCYHEELVSETYPCLEETTEEKCDTQVTSELSVCTKDIPVTSSYPCKNTNDIEECNLVDMPIPKTCFKDVEVDVPYQCYEKQYVNQCVDLVYSDPNGPAEVTHNKKHVKPEGH
eukprot:GHVS01055876.1.p1 GENE.GHVS01055876.1~~GHVS01055876.1.p1  ORF type:complete len:118 (+),score=10.96 GHVS01055876.1:430-783(+)